MSSRTRQSRYAAQRAESAFLRLFRVDAWLNQGRRCVYCREPLSRREATGDHVKPRSAGGSTTRDNILAACKPCNLTKGSLPIGLFKRLIKSPLPNSPMAIWRAWSRRRIWVRQERAERRILALVGVWRQAA